MIKTIALVFVALLVLLLAGLAVLAAAKPDTFRVVRTTTIKSPPEKIFPFIADFRKWSAWSPYERKDPAMKRIFSGPTDGAGAIYIWEGNKEVGIGRMEISEALPPKRIVLKLDFVKPVEAHNIVEFTLEPQGDSTVVTWDMHGPAPFISKVMQVFFNLDKMVGTDFEAGLAALKTVAER